MWLWKFEEVTPARNVFLTGWTNLRVLNNSIETSSRVIVQVKRSLEKHYLRWQIFQQQPGVLIFSFIPLRTILVTTLFITYSSQNVPSWFVKKMPHLRCVYIKPTEKLYDSFDSFSNLLILWRATKASWSWIWTKSSMRWLPL